MFNITSRLNFARTLGSTVMLGIIAAQRGIQTLTFKKQIPIVFVLILSAGISSSAQSFNDEFDGTAVSLDTSGNGVNKWHWHWYKWNVNALSGNSDDYFKMFDSLSYNGGPTVAAALSSAGYGSGPFLHQVSGGTLKLRAYPAPAALKNSIWGYPYVGSMISTERSHSFKTNTPGSVEFRYRNNTVDKGTHVAAWLLDINGNWPPEIDIVEAIRKDKSGNGPFFFTNAHGAPTGPKFLLGGSPFEFPGVTAWEDWQVFRLEWTASELIWKRNGVVTRRQANYLGSRSMYFLLTLEGASNWPGNPDSTTRWPQVAEIDYVRITEGTSPTPPPPPPPPPSGDNLVQNPGFEARMNKWSGWGGKVFTGNAHTGTYAIGSGKSTGAGQDITSGFTVGQSLTLTGWGKFTSTGTNDGWISADCLDSGGRSLGFNTTYYNSSGTAYIQKSVTFTVPANTAIIRVSAWKGTGSAWFYADDISLQ